MRQTGNPPPPPPPDPPQRAVVTSEAAGGRRPHHQQRCQSNWQVSGHHKACRHLSLFLVIVIVGVVVHVQYLTALVLPCWKYSPVYSVYVDKIYPVSFFSSCIFETPRPKKCQNLLILIKNRVILTLHLSRMLSSWGPTNIVYVRTSQWTMQLSKPLSKHAVLACAKGPCFRGRTIVRLYPLKEERGMWLMHQCGTRIYIALGSQRCWWTLWCLALCTAMLKNHWGNFK